MPLLDDLALPPDEREMSRRRFLSSIGVGALSVAGIGTAVVGMQYLRPNVLFEPESRFRAGPVSALPVGGVLVFPERKVYLVRSPEGVYALSMTCTHLGCMTRFEPASEGPTEGTRGRIFCPCHGSRFHLTGQVIGGPAPRPLPRLLVSLKDGVLEVDTRKVVEPDFLLKV